MTILLDCLAGLVITAFFGIALAALVGGPIYTLKTSFDFSWRVAIGTYLGIAVTTLSIAAALVWAAERLLR